MRLEARHDNAVRVFYRQEVVTLIDFRTALDVIERVSENPDVPGDFFCNRDVERLKAAFTALVKKLEPHSIAMATYPEPLPDDDSLPHNNS